MAYLDVIISWLRNKYRKPKKVDLMVISLPEDRRGCERCSKPAIYWVPRIYDELIVVDRVCGDRAKYWQAKAED